MRLFISLQNEVILLVDYGMEKNIILNFQTSVLLDDVSNYLGVFKTFKETSMIPQNDDFYDAFNVGVFEQLQIVNDDMKIH